MSGPSCTTDVLCDLGQVVNRSSPSVCPRRGPPRLTRPVILERVPLSLQRPPALGGPESAQPRLEPALKNPATGVLTPFGEHRSGLAGWLACWERRVRRRQGALPHRARLPRVPSQGQRGGDGRRWGSGWPSPTAPTPPLRSGFRTRGLGRPGWKESSDFWSLVCA